MDEQEGRKLGSLLIRWSPATLPVGVAHVRTVKGERNAFLFMLPYFLAAGGALCFRSLISEPLRELLEI